MKEKNNYIDYIISNLVVVNEWIEKFGIADNKEIIKHSEFIANELNSIMEIMKEMGIDINQCRNESFDIDQNIRDFKIKRILLNESN